MERSGRKGGDGINSTATSRNKLEVACSGWPNERRAAQAAPFSERGMPFARPVLELEVIVDPVLGAPEAGKAFGRGAVRRIVHRACARGRPRGSSQDWEEGREREAPRVLLGRHRIGPYA